MSTCNLVMNDKEDNVFFFAQVSDIHLHYKDPSKQENFELILKHLKNIIKPEFVLATGDFADSMNFLWLVRQQPSEWKAYENTMKLYNDTFNVMTWYDVRGNHDNYGEPDSINSMMNNFNKHSVYGSVWAKQRVMSFVHQKTFGKYRFVGFDANIEQPTMLNPHNFFGKFYRKDMDELERELSVVKDSNHTFVYNHYPIAVIHSHTSSSGKDMFGMLKHYRVLAHFCGHLHNCYGLCPYLKANLGHLELELQDMKSNHKYRILAVDHDILSYNDLVLDQFPAVLITNPKDARYNSDLEPLHRMKQSTHIRMYVFSLNPVKSVQVFIDGKSIGSVDDPTDKFITLPWNTTQYEKEFHQIKVVAKDNIGTETTTEHTFSLEGSVPPLNFQENFAKFFLQSYWSTVLQVIFILIYSCILAFLVCLKIWHFYIVRVEKKVLDLTKYNRLNQRLITFVGWEVVFWPYIVLYLLFPFSLWEIYLFGIMELFHTFFPILIYYIYVSGSNHSYFEMLVNVAFFLYVAIRVFDCIWHFTIFNFVQIIWPLTGFEFWILTLLIMSLRDGFFLKAKIQDRIKKNKKKNIQDHVESHPDDHDLASHDETKPLALVKESQH